MNSLPAWIAGHLSAERRREALSGTLLFLAAAAVHSRGLANGFIWDDNSYVTLNPLVTGEARLADIWLKPEASPQYYPLLFTFLRIQYALWGPWPPGFHLVSILLHAASAVVLWRILKRLEAPGAWAAALLFGIHPVQVETVAWITEQKNVFSGFFYFLSFLFGLRAFTPPGEGRGGKIAFRPCYGAALAFFVLALLCKTVTATLPVSLLAVWWWKRGRPTRALLIGLAPFLALGAAAGAVTSRLEVIHVGAMGAGWSFTPAERFLIASRAVPFYAAKLLCPLKLMFIYPRWEIDAGDTRQYLFAAGLLLGLALLFLFRSRLGRGPLAALAVFAATLGPALGFVDFYPMRFSFVADHFQYLACAPLLALLSAACAWLGKAWKARGFDSRIPACAAAAVFSALAVISWRQTGNYLDEETLWRRASEANPKAAVAFINLASLYLSRGREAEGLNLIESGRRTFPNQAEFPTLQGELLANKGRWLEAKKLFEEALRMEPGSPAALDGLARAALEEGDARGAASLFGRAAQADKRNWTAFYRQARALYVAGSYREAAGVLRRLLSEHPEHAESHFLLGLILAGIFNEVAAAEEEFRLALRYKPGYPEAHYNLGLALASSGETDAAAAHWREALRLRPDFREARENLEKLAGGGGR